LSDDEIARIKAGAGAGWGPADSALISADEELHDNQFISPATWAALSAHFDEKQRMDVVFTAGQYTQVSMMLNTFGIQLDAGLVLDPELAAISD
ncbi:MAG: carboxymuconolactone decarboxylase family protein, partial [Hyphomonadaceae bacterium]